MNFVKVSLDHLLIIEYSFDVGAWNFSLLNHICYVARCCPFITLNRASRKCSTVRLLRPSSILNTRRLCQSLSSRLCLLTLWWLNRIQAQASCRRWILGICHQQVLLFCSTLDREHAIILWRVSLPRKLLLVPSSQGASCSICWPWLSSGSRTILRGSVWTISGAFLLRVGLSSSGRALLRILLIVSSLNVCKDTHPTRRWD